MQDIEPRVSILIPTYNGAEFIGEALQSAVEQTERDVEIVVIDDASTDDTVARARRAARSDDRIRVCVNPRNLGLVENWNEAVRAARGEWVKFLFQDDLLAPSCVERLLDAAAAADVPFASCARAFAFEPTYPVVERARYHENKRLIASIAAAAVLDPADAAEFAIDHVGINFVGEPTVTLIRRDMFERYGVFDAALAQRCDTEFWVRLAVNEGLAMVPEELATFRVHSGSTSAANYGQRAFADESLDPLVILHHYLFDAAYAPLRRVARRANATARLNRLFWNSALDVAREAARSGGEAGPDLRPEWERVVERYPRLARAPAASRLTWLGHRCASIVAHALKPARHTGT